MTMMTFRTMTPEECGVVELDNEGIVTQFHEKIIDPPGNLANGAVYLLEPEVINWLQQHPTHADFSTEVVPYFMGRIATWENTGIHRDIGTLQTLRAAQIDPQPNPCWPEPDIWELEFSNHPIHKFLD